MSKRVAVAVRNKQGLSSQVASRFSEAEALLVVDVERRAVVEEWDRDPDEPSGLPILKDAVVLRNKYVDTVISARYDPVACQSLNRVGIEMLVAPDWLSVEGALDRFDARLLRRLGISVF